MHFKSISSASMGSSYKNSKLSVCALENGLACTVFNGRSTMGKNETTKIFMSSLRYANEIAVASASVSVFDTRKSSQMYLYFEWTHRPSNSASMLTDASAETKS